MVGTVGARCECGCGATPTAGKRFISGHNARLNGGPQGGFKHGHARIGREHPLYQTWHMMIQRCGNPCHRSFSYYGGRGIKVCERWRKSFETFLADVGERPAPGMRLDRWPDQNGDYEPGNIRWATSAEQAANKRSARLLTIGGRTQSVTEWALEVGISRMTIFDRLDLGWSPERAVFQPRRPYPARAR